MIVVDTSALMAVLLNEAKADDCTACLETQDHLLISTGTVAEALIVAGRRNVGEEMHRLLAELGFEQVGVSPAAAREVADAYALWGKRRHPAALNFGDCFAYALARSRDCPLLYVGQDFSRTDVRRALEDHPAANG